MSKDELRQKYKSLRQGLNPEDIDELSLKIANQALKLDLWAFKTYHIFLSISKLKEINTEYLLHILHGKDKNVVVPKVKGQNLQNFLLTDSTQLRLSEWNIPEPVEGILVPPEQIDVVFLPLLAFDNIGNRIGYGKGFYDKFLNQCRPETLKVGLSFFKPEASIESLPHDIQLDYCITPHHIYTF